MNFLLRSSVLFLMLSVTGPLLTAQNSMLPHMNRQELDWSQMKNGLPNFPKSDAIRFVIKLGGLAPRFEDEHNKGYEEDFHFYDVNKDGMIDVIYSGATPAEPLSKTVIMLYDDSLMYRKTAELPGYLHAMRFNAGMLRVETVQPGYGAEYLDVVHAFDVDTRIDSTECLWQTAMYGEIPEGETPTAFLIPEPIVLRSSPEYAEAKPVDLDQDGDPDTEGNIMGHFPGGTQVLRMAQKEVNGEEWSYVIVVEGKPEEGHIFYGLNDCNLYGAGWVLSQYLTLR